MTALAVPVLDCRELRNMLMTLQHDLRISQPRI
ncbi:hypothetical protein SEA_MAGRITTE_99 [Microbacterium phage Magritte]|nr:hypothetical protein SEA_MAGRITTE_99 [Microbacterium phage Magritte]